LGGFRGVAGGVNDGALDLPSGGIVFILIAVVFAIVTLNGDDQVALVVIGMAGF
jgi:hypothetical protein